MRHRDGLHQFHDPSMFVFLDESQRSKADRRKRCWAPRGRDNTIVEFLHQGITYMLLAACDINGFVPDMCDVVLSRRSSTDTNPTRGTVDTERFLLYLAEKIVPHLGSAVLCQPRSIVVMDNAPVHTDPRVKQMINAAGALLIYCAPYSPDLNPIEPCFHQYKAYLRRHMPTGASIGQLHIDALSCITAQNMLHYYRSIRCIRNLPLSDPDTVQVDTAVVITVVAVVLRVLQSRKRKRLAQQVA